MSYEDLPYDELRDKAFDLAESRHDVGFFYDLYRHTPAMNAMASEGVRWGDIRVPHRVGFRGAGSVRVRIGRRHEAALRGPVRHLPARTRRWRRRKG